MECFVLCFPVLLAQVSAVLLQNHNEPEVRHRNHDRHRAQHARHESRALRPESRVHTLDQLRQLRLHRRLHAGVHHEAPRSTPLLLQAALERL